ncbi:hypothetical protein ACT6QH_02555 [Xanthobacter sp. TB0139]|uniref:hypothetical protein n=1 Tax=Xanthobacter sp. TB0139 TaxID=3459178 RepID=UPI00403A0000
MSRMAHLLLTGAALSCAPLAWAASPAFAQAEPPAATAPAPANATDPAQANSRFSFSQTDDGALRLDSKTGAVSLCAKGPEGYACKLLPDSQKAYEAELARLRKEIATLKGETGQTEQPELDPGNLSGDMPPDPADVDAVLDYAEKFFLRLKQMYENLNSSPAPNPQEEQL